MQWIQSQSNRYAVEPARLVFGLILLLAGLPAAASWAQSAAQGTAQVNVARANFRATCSLGADVVASLTEGEEIEILESVGDWYRVRHPESGVEGCMHRTVLGPVTAISTEEAAALAEREQELREREAEAREAELEAKRERREAELEAREEEAERHAREADWAARRARGEKRVTGYLDLNIGYGAPGEDQLDVSGAASFVDAQGIRRPWPGFSEVNDSYDFGGGFTYGVGGGVLVLLRAGGSVGGGAAVTRSTYSLDISSEWILDNPDNPFVGDIASDRFRGEGPDRTETALHLHAIYAPPFGESVRERLQVRVFVGPTVFWVDFPAQVGIADWQTGSNPWRFNILALEYDEQSETVVGGHIGADVAYFFSRTFGIGASALYSRGTETFRFSPPDDQDANEAEVTLGGLSATVGVRFRF